MSNFFSESPSLIDGMKTDRAFRNSAASLIWDKISPIAFLYRIVNVFAAKTDFFAEF